MQEPSDTSESRSRSWQHLRIAINLKLPEQAKIFIKFEFKEGDKMSRQKGRKREREKEG